MNEEVAKIYGQKLRVRACGICWDKERLLLVNHAGITSTNFWAPPGGGIEFGQTIEEALKKEFLEETGLQVQPEKFLFGCELIQAPVHAIELFYSIRHTSGHLRTGYDPEIQIIQEVRFMTLSEIKQLPAGEMHGILRMVNTVPDLRNLSGFFRI
jgi:8-oxo-dGTP diphosphatase